MDATECNLDLKSSPTIKRILTKDFEENYFTKQIPKYSKPNDEVSVNLGFFNL